MSDRTIQAEQKQFQTPLLLSKQDAATLLGVCVRSIDNYIVMKELPCRRFGRRVLIPYDALLAFARCDHLPAPEPKTSAEGERK
jgi:excisionase family DNA binding protein